MTKGLAETKGQRTRARVLDAAIELFGASGYRTTSVASIARACDIAPTLVFAYWPSKEALFRSAVDADAHAVVADLLESLSDRQVMDDPLAPVTELLGVLGSHPLSRRILAGAEPEGVDQLLGLVALEEVRAFTEQTIVAAQAAGTARSDLDAHRAASGYVSLVLTLTMAALQLPAPQTFERVDGVREILSAAFRAPR